MFLSPHSPDRRGLTEAAMRRHGWGAWPGITVKGEPAPEHLCPPCRGIQAQQPARPSKVVEGQQALVDTVCYSGHNRNARQGN